MPQLLYNGRFDQLKMPITADDMLDYFIDLDNPSSMVLIVPTQRFANQLKIKFIRDYFNKTGKPCTNINIFTLQRFAEFSYFKLFKENSGRIISEPYYITLIEEAIEQSDLEFFRSKSKSMSLPLITKIAAIIFGIKEDGIAPEVLFKDLENYQPELPLSKEKGGVKEPKRLKDIAIIFAKYQELLGDKLLDKSQVLIELNNKIDAFIKEKTANSFQNDGLFDSRPAIDDFPLDAFFPDDSVILFYGFSEFKLPEVKFISNLSYSNHPVAINLDYTEINGPLFGNLREAAANLKAGGFNETTVYDEIIQFNYKPEYDINLAPSKYLRRWLFNVERDIRNPHIARTVKIIAAENQLDEVRSIAKIVHHLVKVENIPIYDICICMRSPESYTSLFREVFALNNIPAIITDRFKLSNSQLITTIILALETVCNGYSRNDLIKLIQSSFIEFAFADDPIDTANLISISKKLRIFGGNKRGGKIAWTKAIESRIQYFESLLMQDELTTDAFERYSIQEYINSLKLASNDLEKIFNLLDFTNTKYSHDEINLLIKKNIIEKLKIKQSILHYYNDIEKKKSELNQQEYIRFIEGAEKDAAALLKFVKLIDELNSIANERTEGKKELLEDFVRKLKIATASEKYQIKEKAGWGVTITAIEQTRGVPYKAIILCGAVDGNFPLKYRTETMLGKLLPASESRHLESEKIQFYQFLTNNPTLFDSAEQKIYITYPTHREEQELVPSPFINALCKISTIIDDNNYIHLADVRNEERKTGTKDTRLTWLNYLTEKSEVLGKYSSGEIDDNSLQGLVSESDLLFLSNFSPIIKNLSSEENLELENLSESAVSFLKEYKNKAYSISELERYSQCPFAYFTQYLLKIKQPEDDTKQLTPFERGDLLHIIVYKFYTYLRSLHDRDGIVLIKLNPNNRKKYLTELLKIAESELEKLQYSHAFFEIEKQAIMGTTDKKGLLEYWLDNEIRRHSSVNCFFFPALFEYSFGMGRNEATNKKNQPLEIAEGVLVKGKIDRIEFDPQLNNFLIADYKTKLSNLPTYKDIEKFKKFQIPIYLAAAKKILAENYQLEDITPSGGIYYSFIPYYKRDYDQHYNHKYIMLIYNYLDKIKSDKFHNGPYLNPEMLEEQITKSIEAVKQILEHISTGKFAKNVDLQSCKYCDYHPICRRMDTKSQLLRDFDGNSNSNENVQ